MIEVGISAPLMIIFDPFINKCVKSFAFLFFQAKRETKAKIRIKFNGVLEICNLSTSHH